MKLQKPITTERLILRSLRETDASANYLRWMNDPEINQYLESRFKILTLENIRTFITQMEASASQLQLGIFIREDLQHIGNIKLGPIDPYHKKASLGLLIGEKEYWGKGFAYESIKAAIKFAFNELGLQKLTSGCYASNVGSKKAFEKVGFQVEGYFRSHVTFGDRREDVYMMGMLKNEFIN